MAPSVASANPPAFPGGATTWQVGLLVLGYALLELVLVVLAVPILLAEAVLLASLAWPAAKNPKWMST